MFHFKTFAGSYVAIHKAPIYYYYLIYQLGTGRDTQKALSL